MTTPGYISRGIFRPDEAGVLWCSQCDERQGADGCCACDEDPPPPEPVRACEYCGATASGHTRYMCDQRD